MLNHSILLLKLRKQLKMLKSSEIKLRLLIYDLKLKMLMKFLIQMIILVYFKRYLMIRKSIGKNSDLILQIYVDLKMHIKKFLKFMKVIKVISILHFHVLRDLEINMFAFMELIFRRELLLKRCILILIIFNIIL